MIPEEIQSRIKTIIHFEKESLCNFSTISKLDMLLKTDIIKAIEEGANKPQELAKAYIVEWLKNNNY